MINNVGLLGFGNVGSGVAKVLIEEEALLASKLGWPVRLVKAVVRNPAAARRFTPPEGLFSTDPASVVGNPEVEVVCELIGGIEPAKTLILKALAAGQHVAGSIPVVRTLKEGLSANRIQNLYGILNGTTNLILTRMSQDRLTYGEALAEAQEGGFAEADPSADVLGHDAAHKLILLTALAYGVLPTMEEIHIEGVTDLEPMDIAFAAEFGFVVKLLALSAPTADGRLEVRLHPAMLPASHLLSGVGGVMNAVMIRGHACGDIFL